MLEMISVVGFMELNLRYVMQHPVTYIYIQYPHRSSRFRRERPAGFQSLFGIGERPIRHGEVHLLFQNPTRGRMFTFETDSIITRNVAGH